MSSPVVETRGIVVIGGGPAGLMAAEAACEAGCPVDLFDAMPSVGRKFLLAGKGGMNITHAEPRPTFDTRYGTAQTQVRRWLDEFDASALREWVHGLGIETFVGTSGRVFPAGMKAGPLLRAWLRRLRERGVVVHVRHRWLGWEEEDLVFATRDGRVRIHAPATVLALGGGSWARLGSDGQWVALLRERGIPVDALKAANCGFERPWSAFVQERYAGAPVKNVTARVDGDTSVQRGEFIVSRYGVEGGLVYACAKALRDGISAHGEAVLHLDLLPDIDFDALVGRLARGRAGLSMSNRLRAIGLQGVKAALLRELAPVGSMSDPARVAAAVKNLPLSLFATRPLDEAISSAGGVAFDALDERLMLNACPGVFCAGEMLDWEAPTGGYLLTACIASGRVAGLGASRWLRDRCAG